MRAIPITLVTVLASLPASGVVAAHPFAAKAKSKHRAKTTATAKRTSSKKYRGPSEDMQWGPVQVTITVKGKKITNATATAPMERPRSAFINQQVLPMLRQETLHYQSANIDLISGATLTSEAYALSLEGALKKAHL